MYARCLIFCAMYFPLCGVSTTLEMGGSKTLISAFWQARDSESLRVSSDALRASSDDATDLFQWLRAGPVYRDDVPVGVQERYRVDEHGRRFPYVYVVPEHYDPAKAYPVEFNLHGAILNQPKWRSGGAWWGKGRRYKKYLDEEHISVFPAAWRSALWWEEEQAVNLQAILIDLKSQYHIDDNRVFLSGVSNGGSGVFFFAFKQPSEWAAFFAYISHPHILSEGRFNGHHSLSMENLVNSALFVVNGEKDPIYPSRAIEPVIELMSRSGVDYQYLSIENGKHDMKWYGEHKANIEQFKRSHPRNPLPEAVRWVADSTECYNEIHWLRIDELIHSEEHGWILARRDGNIFHVLSEGVASFTLKLNPDMVDFTDPVQVIHNKVSVYNELLEQNVDTLLRSARSKDRSRLFTAELVISL